MILQEEINYLKEEVLFLRKDSENKTIIINNLLRTTSKHDDG